jgi:uncharacterized membrane protein
MTRTGEWIGKAWKLLTEGGNFWKFVLLALIYLTPIFIIQGVSQILSFSLMRPMLSPTFSSGDEAALLQNIWSFYFKIWAFAVPFSLFIFAPLIAMVLAGSYGIIINLLKTNRFEWSKFWLGPVTFWQAALAGFFMALFGTVAMIFCFFPILIVQTLYLFPLLLIADRRLSFWQAMEQSRKKVQANFWGFLGFFLVITGINMLGVAACGLGMFVTMPLFITTIAVAYRDLWPEEAAAAILPDTPSS